MLGNQVFSDLQLDSLHSHFTFCTKWGQTAFTKGLQNTTSDPKVIKKRQLGLLALKTETSALQTIHSSLACCSVSACTVDTLLAPADSLASESISQVLFSKTSTGAFLNTNSWALNGIITWRTIVLPGISILFPFLAVVLPFILLKFLNAKISGIEYLEKIKGLILNQISVPSFLKAKHSSDRIGFLLESCFIGLTLAIFISSLWNQVISALHLRTITSTISEQGQHILDVLKCGKQIIKTLEALPPRKRLALRGLYSEGERALKACERFNGCTPLTAFGTSWNSMEGLAEISEWLGKVDVYVTLAQSSVCFPRICSNGLSIKGIYHPGLEKMVRNDFATEGHSILTGPNRGGKSTFCKAVGLALVTAQSWGFAWCESMKWKPFDAIYSALEPVGRLGIASTFEAEIEFAKSVLAIPENGSSFVMMDEIFHSTNATDGVSASQVFLSQLYKKPRTISLISTHYKELTEMFKESAKCIMMDAHDGQNGKLIYSYKVTDGVSTKSSVMEILYERGLHPGARLAVF